MTVFTAVVIVVGLGMLILCAFMWGTQHTMIEEDTARGVRISTLESEHYDRNNQ